MTCKVRMNLFMTLSYGLLHMATAVLTDQQKPSSIPCGHWIPSRGITQER